MLSSSKTVRQPAHALRVFRRTLGMVGCALACACVSQATVASAQTPQVFSGTGTADVASAIAAFKAAIGGADNGTAVGAQPTGYRQVTWDDVPDQHADPNQFPGNYYNTVSPRGLEISATFVPNATNFLRVSAQAGNATATPTLFGLGANFTAFSPQRILIGGNTTTGTTLAGLPVGSIIPQILMDFRVSGSGTHAAVSGFGAVFTDVNLANVSSLAFYDSNFRPLGTFYVPATTFHNTVTFLGVLFPTNTVAHVIINPGTPTTNNIDDATHDLVAVDDCIYAEPHLPPPPFVSILSPTTASTLSGVGPFVSLAGQKGADVSFVSVGNSQVLNFGSRRDEDDYTGTEWRTHNIQLGPGQNVITATAQTAAGTTVKTLTVNSDVFAYHLAEGSTGGFFDTDISIANPTNVAAPVTLTFLREDGGHIVVTDVIGALSQKAFHVDNIPGMEGTAFSTVVTSDNRVPLAVERTMFWDSSYYAGKAAVAVNPSNTWYFAEGVENSFFTTFVQLENPNTAATNAMLTFQLDAGAPVVQQMTLPALSRVTVDTGSIPALVGKSFGLTVQANDPIVAERATYFETTPTQLWAGGHGGPGVPILSNQWYFAEGATGPFRDTFLLLSNPGDQTFPLQINFYGVNTGVTNVSETMLPHSRLTLPLNTLQSRGKTPLADDRFAMLVISPDFSFFPPPVPPFAAERAMYWHGAPGPWADGTTTSGVDGPGLAWAFAEGRVGGPLDFHTYLRIANIHPYAGKPVATVWVTFLKTDGTVIARNYMLPADSLIDIDVNAIPGLQNESFGTLVEASGADIVAERSMYWNSGGVFWAGGITTTGTRIR